MGCGPSALPPVTGAESDAELRTLVYKGSVDAAAALLAKHETLDLSPPIVGGGRPPKRGPKLGIKAGDALGERRRGALSMLRIPRRASKGARCVGVRREERETHTTHNARGEKQHHYTRTLHTTLFLDARSEECTCREVQH